MVLKMVNPGINDQFYANSYSIVLVWVQVRAMQIIDELEKTRRGPYGGGIGLVSFSGGMDISLALRTMVIPSTPYDTLFKVTSLG
jgi:hypothetical protein